MKTYKHFGNTTQVGSLKGYFSTSCAAGSLIPDPKLIHKEMNKPNMFQNDYERINSKLENNFIPSVQSHLQGQFNTPVYNISRRSLTRAGPRFGMTRRRLSME